MKPSQRLEAVRPVAFATLLPALIAVLSGAPHPSAALAVTAPASDATLDRSRFLPASELSPGQRAVCRTVFQGRTVEEFELEIVGVLPGGRAEGDLILARATSDRLKHDGIAAGMSGSPVFVDGKLIGALAYSFTFSRDPLCGITPIAEMLDIMHRKDEKPASGFEDGPAWETKDTPQPVPASEGAFTQLRTPLMTGGLSPAARAALEPWAEQNGFVFVPGGVAGAGTSGASATLAPEAARAALVPGAAIAVDLLRGDANLSAVGTLTYRDGDRVLAFGHPFFQTGNVEYPLALVDITTIVASDLSSFKLGTPREQVGVITQDRRAAVAGSVGRVPRMLPLTVLLHGAKPADDETYRFEILRHRQLAPQLAQVAALSAMTARGGILPEATWHYRATLSARGRPPILLEDVGTGTAPNSTLSLSSSLSLLLNNPFAPFEADSLGLELTMAPGLSRTTVWSANAEPRVVKPGGKVRVTAEMRDWRGGSTTRTLELDVPEGQPEGRFVLAVGGGVELDRQEQTRLPTRHRAASLDELIQRLADRRRADRLYATLYGPGIEAALEGRIYPELPGFAQRLLASDRAARSAAPWGRIDRVAEAQQTLGVPVLGVITLPVEVRRVPVPAGQSSGRDGKTNTFKPFGDDEEDN